MKKCLLALGAALLVSFLGLWPFQEQDTGDLYIVDALLVERDGGGVRLYAGDVSAQGDTVRTALNNLAEQTPGQLFLRQTSRIIFCGGAEQDWDPLSAPEELPVGACVYQSGMAASALDMERWNQVLEAREQRQERTPTLAELENSALTGGTPVLAQLEGFDGP